MRHPHTRSVPIAERPEEGPATQTGLSRQRVIDAAIALADAGGIDAFSMRNLARQLDVGVMSLYYHVKDKDEILVGIVDRVLRQVDLAHDGQDWKESIRRTATSVRHALLQHPWAANLMFSAGDGPARLEYMESLLGTLRRAGFSAHTTHRAYHAVDSHIIGFTLWEASIPFDAEELHELAETFLKELPTDLYPHVTEHIRQHLEASPDESDRAFEFGLDLILDSLDRKRTSD